MSKIEKLIEELCPNGVEYKKLEFCCRILDNKRKPISKNSRNIGIYPYYGANGIQDYIDNYIFDGKYVLIGEDGSVQTQNGNPIVNWAEGKIWVNNHAHIIEEANNVLLRYLFHYLQIVDVSDLIHGNIPKLTGSDFRNIIVPVPPLEVQEEIVRILDKFGELEAELEAELETRKSQYEFWRDKLFEQNVKEKYILEDILKSLKTGLNPRKFFKVNTVDAVNYYVTVKELGERNVRYWESKDKINSEGLQRINERSNLEVNDVLFSGTGTIGKVSLIEKEPKNWNVKEGVYILKPKKEKVIPTYLMYLMRSNYMKKLYSDYIVGSPVSSIPMKELKKIKISLPLLQEQERIVNILDKFDKLVNDISEGLPAEIEARRKQYEYYRNKLLSFEELVVNG